MSHDQITAIIATVLSVVGLSMLITVGTACSNFNEILSFLAKRREDRLKAASKVCAVCKTVLEK